MSNAQKSANSLSDILDQLVENTEGSRVTIGQLLEALGSRSIGPLLVVPALIAVAPTGAIPGMSLVTGAIIFLVSAQLFSPSQVLWLPSKLRQFSFSREKLKSAVTAAKPYVSRIENYMQPRLTTLTETPMTYVVALICMCLAVSMYPLALVPFAVALPGTAVLLFGLALTMRDGALVIAGLALTILSVWIMCSWI